MRDHDSLRFPGGAGSVNDVSDALGVGEISRVLGISGGGKALRCSGREIIYVEAGAWITGKQVGQVAAGNEQRGGGIFQDVSQTLRREVIFQRHVSAAGF